MRTFEIYDSTKRKPKPCGWLDYDEERHSFSIRISEQVDAKSAPMLFEPFIERGELTIPPDWSLRWVQERVVPPSRQNLGEILRAHGMDDYDELDLLVSGNGYSSQDDFLIREVAQTAQPVMPEDALQRIGRALASARDEAGVSQQELSRRTAIQQGLISRIERGLANPTVRTLSDLAQGLGLEVRVDFVGQGQTDVQEG